MIDTLTHVRFVGMPQDIVQGLKYHKVLQLFIIVFFG